MLEKKIGSTGTCARARLKTHTDPKKVFRPLRDQVTKERLHGKFKPRADMLDPHNWYLDPMVKLMLK